MSELLKSKFWECYWRRAFIGSVVVRGFEESWEQVFFFFAMMLGFWLFDGFRPKEADNE